MAASGIHNTDATVESGAEADERGAGSGHAVAPRVAGVASNVLPGDSRRDRLPEMMRACEVLLRGIGEDTGRDGLQRTPLRMAKALLECTQGYAEDPRAILSSALFDVDAGGGMVLVKDIEFHSLCEHHVLPFTGKAHVAYIPRGRVVGLSKIARAVDALAKRLQVQERLTRQLAEAVAEAVGTADVAVMTEATHLCMSVRGATKPGSSTTSTVLLGKFETDSAAQARFFAQAR